MEALLIYHEHNCPLPLPALAQLISNQNNMNTQTGRQNLFFHSASGASRLLQGYSVDQIICIIDRQEAEMSAGAGCIIDQPMANMVTEKTIG